MTKPVRVAVIMDDASFVTGAARVDVAAKSMGDTLVSTSTKVNTSNEDMAAIAKKTSDAQVAAMLKVREASRLRIANLSQTVAVGAGAAPGTRAAEEAAAAQVLLTRENAKLSRSYGEAAVASRGFSTATKEGERDLNKLVRGGLAGSGALSALGRSLAFASSGFIAFAVGATIIKSSIKAAQDEAVAQRQVAAQLKTSGKSWQQYGTQIDSVLLKESHLAGFTKADLLTSFGYLVRIGGNVQKSLKLTALAADVARARSISLQSASIALAKALGGSATALRRLGIIVPKNVSTTQALAYVTQKFAGQAEAGTTASEKFHATLVDTGAVIGTALLPTFNRLATSLSNWLAKMTETGRLQRDLNSAIKDAGDVFHTLEGVIKGVDDVTGSFKNTLEALLAFGFTRMAIGWGVALEGLAAKWGLVTEAATTAGAAQEKALATGGAAGAAGAGGRAAVGGLSNTNIAAIVAVTASVILNSSAYKRVQGQAKSDLGPFGFLVSNLKDMGKSFVQAAKNAQTAFGQLTGLAGGAPPRTITNRNAGLPLAYGGTNQVPLGVNPAAAASQASIVFKSFTDSIANQLAQARAALTKGTADDVAAAKAQIAFIKKEIAAGHLSGQSLIQALGAEASAVSTIQSAEAAAAQKRAAAAQAAAAKIQAAIQNSIDPIKLEVALSRAQALGKPILATLRALRESARKALASGKLSLDQQKQAWDQIASLNQQIAAELKKKTTAVASGFKQLPLKKLTEGLDLTPAQRKALRARLSEVGPNGTIGSDNVGAYGYRIGANDRPVHVHQTIEIDGKPVARSVTKHQQRHRRRNSSQRRGPVAGD